MYQCLSCDAQFIEIFSSWKSCLLSMSFESNKINDKRDQNIQNIQNDKA